MIVPLSRTIKTTFLSKKFTTEFPEQNESLPDGYRGKLRLDMDTCISCSACALICPNKTINMVKVLTDKGEKIMPEVDHARCLFCGLCEEVCPPKCLTLSKNSDLEVFDKRDLVNRPEELE